VDEGAWYRPRAAAGSAGTEDAVRRRMTALREALAISQQELARRLGTHQSVVSRMESGGRRLSLTDLARVAEALGVDAESLLGPAAEAAETSASTTAPRSQTMAAPSPVMEPPGVRARRALRRRPPDAPSSLAGPPSPGLGAAWPGARPPTADAFAATARRIVSDYFELSGLLS
jgi:transcriptional regulator with XRE-family HTH domain